MIRISMQDDRRNLLFTIHGLRRSILAHVGYAVRDHLWIKYMEGKAAAKFLDKRGRKVASYAVNDDAVIVKAYPLNLFEKTFIRYGQTYPGMDVFSKKLPPDAERIAQQVAEQVAQKELTEVGVG